MNMYGGKLNGRKPILKPSYGFDKEASQLLKKTQDGSMQDNLKRSRAILNDSTSPKTELTPITKGRAAKLSLYTRMTKYVTRKLEDLRTGIRKAAAETDDGIKVFHAAGDDTPGGALNKNKGKDPKTKDRNQLRKDVKIHGMCLVTPLGTFKRTWETLKFLLLLYQIILLPLEVTFLDDDNPKIVVTPLYIFEKLIDVFFLLDIILNFLTPILDRYEFITDHSIIAIKYLKGWFFVDFLTIIPFEEIISFSDTSNNNLSLVAKLVKIARLLRLIKLVRLVRSFDFKNNENYLIEYLGTNFKGTPFFLVLPNFLLIIFVAHLYACIWYYIGNIDSDDPKNWITLNDSQDDTIPVLYCKSLYFVAETFTTAGYGDVKSLLRGELGFRIFGMITGVLIYSLFSGQIVEFRSNRSARADAYLTIKERMDSIWKKYLLPEGLYLKIDEKIANRTSNSDEVQEYDFSSLTKEELDTFEYNKFINMFCTVNLISKSKDKRFVVELGRVSKKKYYSEDQIIYQKGEPAAAFFFILSGEVEVLSTLSDNYPILKIKSGFFGEYEVLNDGYREFTVRASKYSKIYQVQAHDLKEILLKERCKEFYQLFRDFAVSRQARVGRINKLFVEKLTRTLFWRIVLSPFKLKNAQKKSLKLSLIRMISIRPSSP